MNEQRTWNIQASGVEPCPTCGAAPTGYETAALEPDGEWDTALSFVEQTWKIRLLPCEHGVRSILLDNGYVRWGRPA